ncbi:diacylglycerol kinase [Flavobacterium sp. NST-5]|uniref:Diacylglycerol kinase n=1 Tax=Flavobacterium ichthyis TaxID=2698827 RepID=A0ABW9Z7X3_9FLAO|nr:diacylglycerol kinase family protein [Flavobacterium ichthyis]NBL64779.1 diacylglycerol kinase [Flavobacterium ichthyis]
MKPNKTVLLVVNPISGDEDKAELIEAVSDFAASKNIDLEVYETTGDDDDQNILELQKKVNAERVLVAGGDGTIKMVAEALHDSDIIIGILPAGSANGLAVDLDLPDDMQENIRIAMENDAMEMDMVCINGKKSLHLSDIGLNAELVKNYENSSIRGKLGYALQAITTLAERNGPFLAKISANDETIETEARMIVIANSQKYGTGVVINPDGKMNDGNFEIVILKNLDIVVFTKILAGNIPVESGDVKIISTQNAFIETNRPVSFQVDGEYCEEVSKLDISILKNQMKVALP